MIRMGNVILTCLVISLQPALASAQHWEPSPVQKAKLLELAATYDQWLRDHQPPLYYDIIEGRDLRSLLLLIDPELTLSHISDTGEPVWTTTTNITAAQTISTDEVWPGGSSGYNLTGAGTTGAQLGLWEAFRNGNAGVRTTHESLIGRVTQIDPSAPSDHACHVAGTMISSGVDPNALGMSFQSNLNAYDVTNDTSEMTTAAAGGMFISNHSYGTVAGWRFNQNNNPQWTWFGTPAISLVEDWKFGFYNTRAQQWDQLAYNAPNYLIFKSAGNDRNDFGPTPGAPHVHASDGLTYTDTHNIDGGPNGFECIPTYGCAKNIVTVGAVRDIPGGYSGVGSVVQSAFSGWGPTDDGRIKPDVVANGVQVWSCGAGSDSDYYDSWGTSMAAPNASGSANLLRGQFQALNGAPARSATLKALIIHTADEAGPAPGPDYMNGWGLMNTQSAADVIAGADVNSGIIEDDLPNGVMDTYTLYVNAAGDAWATIVWTDPAGTPPAVSLDPPNPMLVNDLDLRLFHVASGVTYMPWILDPANPANAATTGDNIRDNVEQVEILNAPLGEYQVLVSHKGTLVDGPQQYSLIFSGMSPDPAPNTPRSMKEDAIVQLQAIADAIAAGAPDVDDADDAIDAIEDAIEDIEDSLDPELWAETPAGDIDPERLECEEGEEVFEEELDALDAIFDAIDDGDIENDSLIADLLAVVDTLIAADRRLAEVAIQDAMADPNADDDDIEDALDDLADGDEDAADAAAEDDLDDKEDSFERAMEEYADAWEEAMDAVDCEDWTTSASGDAVGKQP